jgi:hypothetical protein
LVEYSSRVSPSCSSDQADKLVRFGLQDGNSMISRRIFLIVFLKYSS